MMDDPDYDVHVMPNGSLDWHWFHRRRKLMAERREAALCVDCGLPQSEDGHGYRCMTAEVQEAVRRDRPAQAAQSVLLLRRQAQGHRERRVGALLARQPVCGGILLRLPRREGSASRRGRGDRCGSYRQEATLRLVKTPGAARNYDNTRK